MDAAAAGALAVATVAGGRFARRAALRAALSSGAAAVALAPFGARAAGGRRVAILSAAASGAAQEHPVAALPLAVAALAALIDVPPRRRRAAAAGAVASALGAVGTRRFWPVAPREPADVRALATHVEQRPAPDGEGLSIVVNANAGPALGGNPADELREALPRAEVVEVDDVERLRDALEQAAEGGRVVGAAGGDGTLNTAAGIAMEAGKPLLIVPAGTLNHLARDLGLVGTDDTVAAIRDGHAVAVDVGLLAGRPFLNTASFGGYPEFVDARERLEGTVGKWPAALVALVRMLRHGEPCRVEIDGRERRIWMIFIGNCRYHPSGFTPSWRERLDDGLLDIRVVDANQPWARLRLVASVVTGRLGRSRVYEQRTATSVSVRSLDGALRLARDGETFDGPDSFTIEKRPQALAVYVPWR